MQEQQAKQSLEQNGSLNRPKTSSVSPLAQQLPDGTRLTLPNVQPEALRPLHSFTQSTLAPTSEFTRYLLLALPARYIFRSFFESTFLNENAYDWVQNPINKWIDKKSLNPLVDRLETVLRDSKIHQNPKLAQADNHAVRQALSNYTLGGVERIQDFLATDSDGKELQAKLRKLLDKHGALGKMATEEQIIPHAIAKAKHNGVPAITTTGRKMLRDAIRHNYGQIGYGLALGAGSLALGASYSWNVYKDMQSLFTESVAYELDKDPATVTMKDILTSENHIVNSTARNFWHKLLERAGLAAPFFFVAKALPVGVADFTVGLTGARLLQETWNRKPTVFEDLVGFVNHKINPQNGLGQPVTIAEIFDLYQHYSYYNQPDKAFNNVTSNNNEEAKRWSESQILFERVVQLLNHSYAYKHTTQYDEEGNVVQLADFTLPKFIYLLGHNLIDAHDPAKSLVYVEIANAQGITALKKAQGLFEQGADLQQVRDEFGLGVSDIRKLRDHIANAAGTKPGGGSKKPKLSNLVPLRDEAAHHESYSDTELFDQTGPNNASTADALSVISTANAKAANDFDVDVAVPVRNAVVENIDNREARGTNSTVHTEAGSTKREDTPGKAILAAQSAHDGAIDKQSSKRLS